MDLKKSVENAKENLAKNINKKWAEWKAQESREATRKGMEQEAFRKAYTAERIKLKAIEGRIRAQEEVGVTVPATKGEGETPVLSKHRKETPDSGHPITNPKTAERVMAYLQKT
jgi:hypothetical protein